MSQTPEAVHCARHPNVETFLRCSRCYTPICPNCLVQTPVGARCKDCAGLRRLPTFQISPANLAKTIGSALVLAAVAQVLVAMVRGFGFMLTLLAGYAIAEGVSAVNNRRRGPAIAWATAISIVIGFHLGQGVIAFIALAALPMALRIQASLGALLSFNIMGLLIASVAAAIAYYRLR